MVLYVSIAILINSTKRKINLNKIFIFYQMICMGINGIINNGTYFTAHNGFDRKIASIWFRRCPVYAINR